MMKNKGFTIIELLGVLVVLAILGILVSQNIINRIKQNNIQLNNLSKDIFISSAREFVQNNRDQFKQDANKIYCLNYDFLITTPYLNDGMMPKTEDLNALKKYYVKVTYNGENYLYNIVNECESNE